MTKFRVFLVFLWFLLSLMALVPIGAGSPQGQQGQIILGETVKLRSQVLNEERNINIQLPTRYARSDKSYPVLYVLDGENFFECAATTVCYLSRILRIPEMIVVGVPNTNAFRDLSLHPERNGRADNFLKFLESELFPFVDAQYRAKPYRILFGHSLGAIVGIHALFSNPDLFNGIIAASPMVGWYGVWDIVGDAKQTLSNRTSLNKSLIIALGDEPLFAKPLQDFFDILRSSAPKDFDWKYIPLKDDNFDSTPLKTIYFGLESLFAGWLLPQEVAEIGGKAIVDHYQRLSGRLGFDFGIPDEAVVRTLRRLAFDMNECRLTIALLRELRDQYAFQGKLADHDLEWIGYKLLAENKMEDAISAFRLSVEFYPALPNSYDSLGEAYEKAGKMELARKNYLIAYEKAKEQNDKLFEKYKKNFDRLNKNKK